jgi:hypothetical protein
MPMIAGTNRNSYLTAMKSMLLLLLLSTQLTLSAQNTEESIKTLLDRQTTAWNRGDLEAFMEGYWKNDSLRFIGKSGITYGWKRTLDNYKKGYPDKAAMGTLQFTILHINKLSAQYTQVIGKWQLTRTIGNLSGHFTLLLKKFGNQWLIVSDHSS